MPSAGYPIILPRENESVLLGSAILGAVASKKYSTVRDAMKAMNAAGQVCDCLTISTFLTKRGTALAVCLPSYFLRHTSIYRSFLFSSNLLCFCIFDF